LRCLHAFAVIVGQQDDLIDAIANGEAAEVSHAKAGARFPARDLAVGAGRFKPFRNPHGAACEGGRPGAAARIAEHHAMGSPARGRIEEQALDRNQRRALKTPTSKAGRRRGTGPRPIGRRDGSAHRAAGR
jgi:hypothetical protein